MATDIRLKEGLPEITDALVSTYTECSKLSHWATHRCRAGKLFKN